MTSRCSVDASASWDGRGPLEKGVDQGPSTSPLSIPVQFNWQSPSSLFWGEPSLAWTGAKVFPKWRGPQSRAATWRASAVTPVGASEKTRQKQDGGAVFRTVFGFHFKEDDFSGQVQSWTVLSLPTIVCLFGLVGGKAYRMHLLTKLLHVNMEPLQAAGSSMIVAEILQLSYLKESLHAKHFEVFR